MVLRQCLSEAEVAAINASVDHFADTFEQSPNYGAGAVMQPADDTVPSREGPGGNPLAWPQPWCEPVRACLCHPSVAPFLDVVLGEGWRLDHGPSFFCSRKGWNGGNLHGGGESRPDLVEQYFFKSGRIYSGMVVVEYVLADEGPGDGGLAVVPGAPRPPAQPPPDSPENLLPVPCCCLCLTTGMSCRAAQARTNRICVRRAT